MKHDTSAVTIWVLSLFTVIFAGLANAQGVNNAPRSGCRDLPSWEELRVALMAAQAPALPALGNGGLGNEIWGTIVDRDGVVCAVAFTGKERGDQWPGSRVVSAQKASTANAFSLPTLALSTANLYTATQPGGYLFGLQESNPVATEVAYSGNPDRYGQPNDPMVGGRIGGVNVFGGGVALYNARREIVGGLGVSGDTSCADHNIAYRARHTLELDYVPAGVSPDDERRDNIIFDIVPQSRGLPTAGQMPGISGANIFTNPGGFGHAACHSYSESGTNASRGFAATLPANR